MPVGETITPLPYCTICKIPSDCQQNVVLMLSKWGGGGSGRLKGGALGKATTTVQKLDVPGPDEKFCLCWLCAFTKFSSGGAIFPVHLIFEHL